MLDKLIGLLSGKDAQTTLIILIGIALFFTLLPVIISSIRASKKAPKGEKKKPGIEGPKTPVDSEKAETMAEVKAMLDAAKK